MTFLEVVWNRYVTILTDFLWYLMPNSYKKKDVTDDIVLITGAGSGIGRILAIRFSKLGSAVVLWDGNEEENLKTAKLISDDGLTAFPYTCNMSSKDEIYKTAEKVQNEIGKVTILVNNAQLLTEKQLLDTPDYIIEKIFAFNSLAHFWTVKAFLPDMISMDKGHIVTITDMLYYTGINCSNEYCASQAASLAFHERLQKELISTNKPNINVTMICPYPMNEEIRLNFFPAMEPYEIVDKILPDILVNSKLVVVPKYLNILVILKAFLPYEIYNWVYLKLFQAKQITANSHD